MIPESIGKRIARLRLQNNLTQEIVAERVAISRVAVSHIEMELNIPSERTICLLAGLFKVSPVALVEGTNYPQAKAERLPLVVCCYTPWELEFMLLERDMDWLKKMGDWEKRPFFAAELWQTWKTRLAQWELEANTSYERVLLKTARQALQKSCRGAD